MTLLNEAAYLYVYSKKLLRSGKRVDHLKKKLQKAIQKYHETTPEHKEKQKRKYEKVKQKCQDALKEHNELLSRLRHHHTAFAYAMQKENKL